MRLSCRIVAAAAGLAGVISSLSMPQTADAQATAPRPYALCKGQQGLDPAIFNLAYRRDASDEFSGSVLNKDRWHDINPGWEGRDTGRFHASQVKQRNGALRLSAANNGGEEPAPTKYLTGTVVSTATFRYGYYETRTITAPAGITSSFWFYRIEPDIWTELDVYENGGLDAYSREARSNAHVFKLPGNAAVPRSVDSDIHSIGYDVRTRWTVYGMYWTPEKVEFYINGCKVRFIENRHFHQPLNAVFDMEVMTSWMGEPDPKTLPATYQIDYYRVWQ